ncbi:MAG TPA: hypothetical protein DCY70_00400 [Shewanella sp.]|nr:hypothetical protein [Shewanella sp.]
MLTRFTINAFIHVAFVNVTFVYVYLSLHCGYKHFIVKGFANVLVVLYSAPYVNSGIQQCRLFLVVILILGQN